MEWAQSEISIPDHVTRDYRFGRQDSAKIDSDVFADVDFRTGKYTVKKLSGSGAGVQIVKRILGPHRLSRWETCVDRFPAELLVFLVLLGHCFAQKQYAPLSLAKPWTGEPTGHACSTTPRK